MRKGRACLCVSRHCVFVLVALLYASYCQTKKEIIGKCWSECIILVAFFFLVSKKNDSVSDANRLKLISGKCFIVTDFDVFHAYIMPIKNTDSLSEALSCSIIPAPSAIKGL